MPKKWKGLEKLAEECNELTVELMKLSAFPDGHHPGRKRSLIITTEEEIADVEAAIEFFKAKHRLDRTKIDKRKALKIRKFSRWWGDPYAIKKKESKKAPRSKSMIVDAQRHVTTSKNAPKAPEDRPKSSK